MRDSSTRSFNVKLADHGTQSAPPVFFRGRIWTTLNVCWKIPAPKAECEALSYCWDSQPTVKKIICNGARLSVTKNLKLALNTLRRPGRERVLWADAIFIN